MPAAGPTIIDVEIPGHPYEIVVESGLLERLGDAAGLAPGRLVLVHDARLRATHAATALAALTAAGFDVTSLEIASEEKAKTLETVRGLYDSMLAAAIPRGTPLMALGGGIVGDVGGYVAATYHRGLPLVQVPTTLLAMVDASIGGKTGVNHPIPGSGILGKNLIGSFWQPRRVLADPRTLATLDARDLRCGLAECVKHALISQPALLNWLDENAPAIADRDEAVLTDLVARSARCKVGVVEEDVNEAGLRMVLNLGHTFAHAIEPIPELDLRHGEAVAIGLCAAIRCAERHLDESEPMTGIDGLLAALGLPTRLPSAVSAARLLDLMRYDKKTGAGGIRLVLPLSPGHVHVVDDVPDATIRAAWRSVGAS